MLDELYTKAYAKINFNLNVLPSRGDGFHNIESVFQTIDLFDELKVTKNNNKKCTVACRSSSGDRINLPFENTLTLTYKAFVEETGLSDFGFNVELIKGIPSGGGLGGGSSDAAAFLRVLQKFYEIKLTDEQLFSIASKVGSDVFFFTRCSDSGAGCALVSGRGEIVENIKGRDDLHLLLVFPSVSSSTKVAYGLVDEMIASGKDVIGPSLSDLTGIYNKPVSEWTFVNTFTPAIKDYYPEIGEALKLVQDTGALYTEMSGSGSTVFGIYLSRQQAMHSCNLLADNWSCKVAKTVC